MSKILKGLNEVNPHNYDSDWDYQDAVARSGRSRSGYRSQEDDTFDADVAYSRKMYQLGQQQKAAKEKAQRDSDHDRLATGTNEEQLDELSNEKLSKYKTAAALDAGKADKQGDYKRGDKRFTGIVKATKKQFNNDTKKSSMDEAGENSLDPFKHVNPRVNNPKILGTQNRAKTAYYPSSKPPIKKLDKPLPESLGDNLPSKSIQALQQVKQQLEQQRMADLAQWEQDFKQNTVSKFTARQPSFMQKATSTPTVANPDEKHSVLKTRLGQLNKAIEKQGILDNLVQRLDKKGLLTPNIEAGVDTSMLVRDGARDNYVELNKKLDKALEYVKNRLLTNKAAYAKPKAIDEDVEMLDEGVLNRLGSIALGLVLAFGASHSMAEDMYVYQDAATQKLRIATSLDKVPMNALMSFKVDTDSKTVSMIKGNQETPVQVQPAVVKQAQQQASGQTAQQAQPTQTAAPQQTTQSQPLTSTSIQSILDNVKSSVEEQLLDPESAKIKDIKIYDTTDKQGNSVYLVIGKFNSKNRMGGYGGFKYFGVPIYKNTLKPMTPASLDKDDKMGMSFVTDIWYARAIKDGKMIYNNGQLVNEQDIDEEKQRLDAKCWKGYKKQGTKMKGDTRVNNCVPVKESSILKGMKKV